MGMDHARIAAVRRGLEPSGVHRSRRTEQVDLAGSKRPGRSEDDRLDGQLDLHSRGSQRTQMTIPSLASPLRLGLQASFQPPEQNPQAVAASGHR